MVADGRDSTARSRGSNVVTGGDTHTRQRRRAHPSAPPNCRGEAECHRARGGGRRDEGRGGGVYSWLRRSGPPPLRRRLRPRAAPEGRGDAPVCIWVLRDLDVDVRQSCSLSPVPDREGVLSANPCSALLAAVPSVVALSTVFCDRAAAAEQGGRSRPDRGKGDAESRHPRLPMENHGALGRLW